MATVKDLTFKTIAKSIANSASDVLANSDFISRTIGMNNSYEDIMFIVQALGREPISLLGKNYAFIFDHVRRNYMQGMDVPSKDFEYCNKFTFYKEVPTVRFANPYEDPMNLLNRWKPNMKFETSAMFSDGGGTSIHYSESNDGYTNNKSIGYKGDLDGGNPGTATNSIYSFGPKITTCDMIGKTNSNFNHGKYETLVARFHTNSQESKSSSNPTQTANSKEYGLSHGRNLLKKTQDSPNGYDNPYCRVWTYHHQYNQIKRQIRPIEEGNTEVNLESLEQSGNYNTVGFRTSQVGEFDGGSKRLDDYGVLNYQNGTVNIAPTAKIKDYFDNKSDDYKNGIISTKKCMFSLENLAWRDTKVRMDEYDQYGLSAEQKGPLGGRIMWFPPYNLSFNEGVSVNWNANKFIGRGEDVLTYTNTERTGNLSFTLLIDHPSILDYWTGRDKNGKNQGITLAEGNSGGIDNKNNQENTLLRFFAGCDILSAKPQLYRTKPNAEPTEAKEVENPKNEVPPTDVTEKESKRICAILYYPNNYSGVDDLPFGSNVMVNAVYYLMNGIGAQKFVGDDNIAVDIPLTDTNEAPVDTYGAIDGFGGYEMQYREGLGGNGISITEHPLLKNKRADTYVDPDNPKAAEYLTNENALAYNFKYGDNKYPLAKIIGSEAKPYSKVEDNDWFEKRWYYRVDHVYENDTLTAQTSYIDTKSFGLNRINYDLSRTTDGSINVPQESDTFHLISFTDLFCALEGGNNKVIQPINEEDVKLVKKIFNQDGIKIKSIGFRGHASSAGYGSSNATLSDNRAKTFKAWMMVDKKFPKPENGDAEILDSIRQDGAKNNVNNGDANTLLAKIWRSASVMIEYTEESVENQVTAEETKVKTDANGNVITGADGKPITVDKVDVKTKETSNNPYLKAIEATVSKDKVWEVHDNVTNENHLNSDDWETYDNSYLQDNSFKQSVVRRYDNEGEFFKVLTEEEPFLHHLITNKIKYFDPAFHSISPEGFNARLTFLHQCTRQGSTVGNSDGGVATTAYNLAFGRPPVCVLRLGDFYNTKIVIKSININYENAQWDMNPEGIGMMPMFANIDINFVFLGGSDLAGPISRLQNAVSFNYYANASVYDNRAEKVKYDPNGSGKEIAFKGYNYPNEYVGDRLNRDKIGTEKGYAEEF